MGYKVALPAAETVDLVPLGVSDRNQPVTVSSRPGRCDVYHRRAERLGDPGALAGRPLRSQHASTQTTQLYALLDDKVADAEIRAARRRRDRPAR